MNLLYSIAKQLDLIFKAEMKYLFLLCITILISETIPHTLDIIGSAISNSII